jgi:hypothetical protein
MKKSIPDVWNWIQRSSKSTFYPEGWFGGFQAAPADVLTSFSSAGGKPLIHSPVKTNQPPSAWQTDLHCGRGARGLFQSPRQAKCLVRKRPETSPGSSRCILHYRSTTAGTRLYLPMAHLADRHGANQPPGHERSGSISSKACRSERTLPHLRRQQRSCR